MAIKLTIILPNYNHEKYIIERLDSIRIQTYKQWETIIIDDASTDDSLQVLESYLRIHPNFKVKYFIKNKLNSGSGYKSWQRGIALAKTDYVWIAETDDYADPTFLESLIGLLDKHPECALAFSGNTYVDENGNRLYDSTKRLSTLKIEKDGYKIFCDKEFSEHLPFHPLITNASSVVFRKPNEDLPTELFDYKQCSDIFLWTYLVKDKCAGIVNKNLNYFRQHAGSTTLQNYELRKVDVYKELIAYLNYFCQTDKYQLLVRHYIKHYVWSHRSQVFNIKFLRAINTSRNVYFYYFKCLFQMIMNKLSLIC